MGHLKGSREVTVALRRVHPHPKAKQIDTGIGKRLKRFRLLLANKELRFEFPILRNE
jgi:hypothetical protein